MRYEFSWKADEETRCFATSCPQIAEAMMRSQADFPRRTADIQLSFDQIYGGTRGKFEKVLCEAAITNVLPEIETGIPGLMVRINRKQEMEMC